MKLSFNKSGCFSESDIYVLTGAYVDGFARNSNWNRHNFIEIHKVYMSKDFIYIFNILQWEDNVLHGSHAQQ